MTSVVAVAAFIWIVTFHPPTQRNRRRSKMWLILLLGCQAILALLPDRQNLALIARLLTPTWIGIVLLIGLLHIESRFIKSDWLALVDSLRKPSVQERLKKGFLKLITVGAFVFAVVLFVSQVTWLTGTWRTQMASKSWPVAQADLVRCEPIDGREAMWNSVFHVEYRFDVNGKSYVGNNYDMVLPKEKAFQFKAAKETVEHLNSLQELQVAYNPANPSQNLIRPGVTKTLTLSSFYVIVCSLFFAVLIRLSWTYLAVSRFTDPDCVYRTLSSSRYDFFYLSIGTSFVCTIGFFYLAPLVPISTSLFGSLMLFIAVCGSYCWTVRSAKAQSKTIAKKISEGKTIVHGLGSA